MQISDAVLSMLILPGCADWSDPLYQHIYMLLKSMSIFSDLATIVISQGLLDYDAV